MPIQNYQDMEPEVLDAYRTIGKDVVAINSFTALVPEVFYFGEKYQQQLQTFFKQRQEIALAPGTTENHQAQSEKNSALGVALRQRAEEQLRQRLTAIKSHMKQTGENFVSLEKIFLPSFIDK